MSFFNQPPASNTSGTAPTSGNIFGNASGGASGGIFGQSSTTNSAPSGGLFGAAKPATSGLFGGGTTTPSTTGTTTTFGGGAGGLFGGGASNTSTAASSNPSNSLFGGGATTGTSTGGFGGGNLFGLPKTTDQSTVGAAKPTTPSFFGNPSSTAAPASSTPALGGGLFGTKPADSTAAASTTPAAPSGGLFGGSLFPKPEDKDKDKAASTPVTTAPAPSSFFNLGGNKDAGASKDATAPAAPVGGLFGFGKAQEKPVTATPAPPTSFNLFGGAKDATAEKKDAPAAATPSLGLFGAPKTDVTSTEKKDAPAGPPFNLFGAPKDASADKKDTTTASLGLGQPSSTTDKKDATATGAGALSVTTTSAPTNISVPPPSMLRGKTIEEIVNRWSTDLETHVKEFHKFASEVAVWDRALIENGNNLAALYSHVLAAEREQNEIDQSLDHIEQQQKDLSSTLDVYEKATEEILGGQGGSLRALDTGPADNERDKNYVLATELHTHLDDLSGSLTQMIDSVNALSLPSQGDGKSQQSEDPMAQIAQILSSHLESLQWIDGAVREVESKVSEVERGVRDAGGAAALTGGNKSRGFGLNR